MTEYFPMEVRASTFRRIVQMNDWGTRYLEYDEGNPISCLSRAIVPDGPKVSVRWGDGRHEILDTISVDYTETVNDHGHECVSSGKVTKVLRRIAGQMVACSLDGAFIDPKEWRAA